MAHPLIHAKSSVKKYGGKVEELEQLEKEERAKFSSMTDDMLEAIDEGSLYYELKLKVCKELMSKYSLEQLETFLNK